MSESQKFFEGCINHRDLYKLRNLRMDNGLLYSTSEGLVNIQEIDRAKKEDFLCQAYHQMPYANMLLGNSFYEFANDGYYHFFIKNSVDSYKKLSEVIGIDTETIKNCAENIDDQYKVFFIWKDEDHTKKRWIEAPNETLKDIQERILYKIIYKNISPTKYAHGFCHGKSIATNAMEHTGKKYVLKMDFKNFFPSITYEMIRVAFLDFTNSENADYIDLALKLCCYKGRLAQGAPTSPALSNIYCIKLDLFLSAIAENLGIKYTRYADDLIFSGNDERHMKTMIYLVKSNIGYFRLNLNRKKTSLKHNSKRQTVTGLVVNKEGQCSVKKSKRMKLRAYMHNILTGKVDPRHVNMNKLRGNVAIINMANPSQGKYFLEKFEQIKEMV